MAFATSAVTAVAAFATLVRTPDILRAGVPARDGVAAGLLGFLAVLLFVHTIRRLSTQDPPPPGETRLFAWLAVAGHGASIALAITGVLDGPPGTKPVPVSLHVISLALGVGLLSSIHLLTRRPRVTSF